MGPRFTAFAQGVLHWPCEALGFGNGTNGILGVAVGPDLGSPLLCDGCAANQHLDQKKALKKPGAKALMKKAAAELRRLAGVLGLFQQDPQAFLSGLRDMRVRILGLDPEKIEEKIALRGQARKDKDFEKADSIRKELSEQKVVLEDTPQGTLWRVEM